MQPSCSWQCGQQCGTALHPCGLEATRRSPRKAFRQGQRQQAFEPLPASPSSLQRRVIVPAAAVAVLPQTAASTSPSGVDATLAHAPKSPFRTAQQLLQYIASISDWRNLQDLYHKNQHSLTTAHIAALAMQLPKAGLQAPAGQEADECVISDGIQGIALELMARLEGQLHVLPSRLLVGVATALDACGMVCYSGWRCAFLSASAALVSQRVQHAPSLSRLHAPASSPSGSGPSDADVLAITRIACIMFSAPGSSEEALSSAALTERLVILLRAAAATATAIISPEPSPGSSALAGALGMPAAALGTGSPGPGLRDQVRLAAEAVQGLLEAEGALARAEAFPPRLMLQVLDALLCLGVFPSSLWLAACYKGLEVTAQPAQMTAARALLLRLGFDSGQWERSRTQHLRAAAGARPATLFQPAPTPGPHQLPAPSFPPATTTTAAQHLWPPQPRAGEAPQGLRGGGGGGRGVGTDLLGQIGEVAGHGSSDSALAAQAAASKLVQQRALAHSPAPAPYGPTSTATTSSATVDSSRDSFAPAADAADSASGWAPPQPGSGAQGQQAARWGPHAAQGVTPSVTGSTGGSLSSPGMVVPDSAVAGMMKLLQDAANSGMLADLKVTVFTDLEGCDPALVLWTAEAFHRLGCPLTPRELSHCLALAASTCTCPDRTSVVPAKDVLALMQRACQQAVPAPPGQLEALLAYVGSQVDSLLPMQLMDLLTVAAAVLSCHPTAAWPPAEAAQQQQQQQAASAAMTAGSQAHWVDVGRDSSRGRGGQGGVELGGGVSSVNSLLPGGLVAGVLATLAPHLPRMAPCDAVQLSSALLLLVSRGVAAALPPDPWMASFCAASAPLLGQLGASELKQVLALVVLAQHVPTDDWMASAAEAATACLQPSRLPAATPSATPWPPHSSSSRGARARAQPEGLEEEGEEEGEGVVLPGSLGDTLAVLEMLILDLGCAPSELMMQQVVTVLVPALAQDASAAPPRPLPPPLDTTWLPPSASISGAPATALLPPCPPTPPPSPAHRSDHAEQQQQQQPPGLGPRERAGALRLLAALHCRPAAPTLQRLLCGLEPGLFQLTPARLALISWSCAELAAVPDRAFLTRYLEASADMLPDMTPHSLALLGRSFAQLGLVPDASWQHAYRDALRSHMPGAGAETLSVMGQGLLHLGLRPDEGWLADFCMETAACMHEADAASVARFAHFLASCGCPAPADWVAAIMQRALEVAPEEYDPPDLLPLVLRSLVKLGWAPDGAWLHEVLRRIALRAPELQPSSLIITVSSLVALQHCCSSSAAQAGHPDQELEGLYDTDTLFACLDVLLQAALGRVAAFTATELRWLLEPLQLLPDYSVHPDTALAFTQALAEQQAAEEGQEEVWVCHDSVAMGLNDFVTTDWLLAALTA